jgi:PAS domain S-box-containing protein
MKTKIRILHIDDNVHDRRLVQDALKTENREFEVIEADNRAKFEQYLAEENFNLVLSDFNILGFDGLQVLQFIKERHPGLPVIIVTGTGSEEVAIQAMKMGAADYVIKTVNHIRGLAPAIKRVLEHKKDQEKRERAEEELRESEDKFRNLFENSPVGNSITGIDGSLYVNKSFCRILGYNEEELRTRKWMELTHPDDIQKSTEEMQSLLEGKISRSRFEKRYIHKNGNIVWTDISIYLQRDKQGNPKFFITSIADISERKLAEEALRKDRILLRALIDNLPISIYVKDKEGRKLIANTADLQMMNRTTEAEVIGKTDLEIYNKETGTRGYEEDMSVLQTGQPMFNHEDHYLDTNGKQHYRLTSKIPLYDEHKQIIGLIGFGHDITERKKAEEELAWEQYLTHSLLDNIPDSIYFKDTDNRFIRINKAMAHLYGLDNPIKAVGKTEKDLNETELSQQAMADETEIIRTGKPIIGKEEMQVLKNSPSSWVSTTKMPLTDSKGKIIGTFGISRNITEIKKTAEQLLVAKEKAEESDRLKTAFLHNISHEIRTPMNAIVGFSGLLNKPGLLPEERLHFTDIIVQSSNQLLTIITDIINIATIEAGQEHVEENETALNSVLYRLYEEYLPSAENNNILLACKIALPDEEAQIVTDEYKLTEILTNLISNALKFIKEGNVTFGYNLNESLLQFYVEDTGIGIPSELHNEIFNRFRQVEITPNREYGGSGLGLTLAKAYAELLGGNIWLNSEPGKGSVFYFTIPYKRVKQGVVTAKPPVSKINLEKDKSKTILVAEDEDYNFMLLEELLSGMKYTIIRAINGIEVVEICKTNRSIDLVLMDIKMPLMNGYEATRQIKKLRPDMPVIAQTAYSTEADKNKALSCGCCDFISKPFKDEELLSKIKEHIA